MAKELYLYSPIWSFTAEDLIRQLEENSKEDIALRMMSPGGGVYAGWGIAAKMKEKKVGKITVKVDGAVASMASTLLFYANKVQALDVSSIMIHRAEGPAETPEDKERLDKVNKDLREKMEQKIDSAKLKALKGYTVADLFESPVRIDCYLSAKEAKEVGLVDEIFDMSPEEIEAISQFSNHFQIAAEEKNHNSNTMTIEEIKAKHPDVYAKIMAAGAAQERERIKAWVHFAAVDAEAVKKGIDGGDAISQLQMIEFMEKKNNITAIEALKAESEENKGGSTAADADKIKAKNEAAEKEKAEFLNNVNAFTGVKIF